MRKIILGVGMLSMLFLAACDKEANVAKDYSYIMDEEFLNNDRGWKEDSSSWTPDASKPDSIVTTYSFAQKQDDNGLLKLEVFDLSKSSTYQDSKDGGIPANGNFIIESSLTYLGGSSTRFSGVTWDNIDDDNYKFFALTIDGNYAVYDVVNGTENELVVEDVLPTTLNPAVYDLRIENLDENLIFSINGLVLDTIPSMTVSSSKVGFYNNRRCNLNIHYLRTQVQ